MVKTTPGSQNHHTHSNSHTHMHSCDKRMDRQDRQADFLFGDKQENDTHLKMRRVTDRLTDYSHTTHTPKLSENPAAVSP